MNFESDLRLALRLADIADGLSMPLFRSERREYERKQDGSPVTTADTSIEQAVREELSRHRPRDTVHGEEFGGDRTGDRVWLIDPIDGTAWFIEGGDQWATLIALVANGTPVVGVISRPATATRWWAHTNGGAFRNGDRLRVSTTERISDATLVDDFRLSAFRRLDTNPVMDVARACRVVEPWQDRFTFPAVAEGRIDVIVGWWSGSGPDLAGQVCIVCEAGGRFSDLHGRLDIDSDVHVVSNGSLHDELLARVQEAIERRHLDPAARPEEDIPAIWESRAAQPSSRWTFNPSI